MIIGLVTLQLRMSESQSLKEKRWLLLSVKTRLRQKFNVSVSETDEQDKWQIAVLSVACVGTDRDSVNETLSHLVKQIERERDVELSDYQLEFF